MKDDDYFWYSKLNTYRTCPTLFKAQYVDKTLPMEMGLDTEFGTAVHLGINDMLEGGDGITVFRVYWEGVNPDLKKFKFDKKCLGFNGEVFLERFERLHLKHFKPHMMEERLYDRVNKLEGTPDFLGDYKGIKSVVDFKTSSSRYDKRKIVAEEQLSFYGHLASLTGYVPTQKVYVVFIKDFKMPSIQILKQELTQDAMNDTIQNVGNEVVNIQSLNNYTKNPQSCVRGPIICPNFQNCWGNIKENKNADSEQ